MEKYLFAAYIFILSLLLVFIFLKGLRKHNEQTKDLESEELKLLQLQMDLQDTILAMENKIEESLKDIAAHRKSIEELAERIERRTLVREELLKQGGETFQRNPPIIAPKSITKIKPSAKLTQSSNFNDAV